MPLKIVIVEQSGPQVEEKKKCCSEAEKVEGKLLNSSVSVLSDKTESETWDLQTICQRGKAAQASFDVIPGRASTHRLILFVRNKNILSRHFPKG